MALTTIMEMNNGVLWQRDHRASRATFDALLRSTSLVRVHPGVYVDAERTTERRTRFAAALAFAPGSVLWGADAASVFTGELDLAPFAASDVVQLAMAHTRRPAPGVRWTKRAVPLDHRSRRHGLRVPSAAYLAVDACATDDGALIERFLRLGLVTPAELLALLPVLASTTGQRRRRGVVSRSLDNPWSGGERALHDLLRTNRITGWVANAELVLDGRRFHPDVLFEEQRLIIEFDGYEVHGTNKAFEMDRERQNALVVAGYVVLRYTWKQVTGAPASVVLQIRTVLARRSAPDS